MNRRQNSDTALTRPCPACHTPQSAFLDGSVRGTERGLRTTPLQKWSRVQVGRRGGSHAFFVLEHCEGPSGSLSPAEGECAVCKAEHSVPA